MQDGESRPEQTSRVTAVNSYNWRRSAITIVITALIAGTSGYWLGTKTSQILPQVEIISQPSLSPQAIIISQTPAKITQPSNNL
jgi:hypothetical protein